MMHEIPFSPIVAAPVHKAAQSGRAGATVGQRIGDPRPFNLHPGRWDHERRGRRHARLVKGLRLKDLADLANCSESMISKIENNKSTPSLNTLHRIARALDTSVAELLPVRSAVGQVVIRKGERQIISEAGGDGGSVETEVMIPFGSSSMLQAFVVRLESGQAGWATA